MDLPVAIITGAGRGIGRASAIELARRDYRLVLVSRTASELEQTAALCGGACQIVAADVGLADAADRVVRQAMSSFGRVDALVHCAGVALMRTVERMTPQEWQAILDSNLSAAFHFCRVLWPIWRKQGGGVAVNVSSYSARDPFPGLGAYGAAKAAVNLLGLALAREGREINVRVHTVAPAATETAMFRSLFSPEQCPPQETLDPAEVARVIAHCITGDLAHTSGEVIYLHKSVKFPTS